LGGTAVIDRLDSIVDLLQRGLFGSPPLLVGIEEHLQYMADNMEDAETRRERMRDKGKKKAGGEVVDKKLEEGEGEDGDGGGGFFSSLIGTILGHGGAMLAIKTWMKGPGGQGAFKTALKGLGSAGRFIPIIGAIIGPLIDGIFGWFKADEWQTSKAGAVVGAALGGTGSGASGAAWGALKGGMIGFAAGGPLGALAGVLIGAVAGWFGGERIAKALDKIGDFFSKEWTKIMDFFGFASEKDTKKLAIERQEKAIKLQKSRKEGGPQKDMFGNVLAYTVHDPEKLREAEEKLANVQAGKGEYTNAELENEITKWSENLKKYESMKVTAKGVNAKKQMEKLRLNAENRLKKLQGAAFGGVIINRPAYLPSSGVVVGEHPSYSGRGTPRDGGPEVLLGGAAAGAVIPLGADRASTFIDPVSRSIAGAVMNQMAYDKIGLGGPAGMGSPPAIVDASTIQNVTNNTIVRSPSPRGQEMHFERSDFVHKIA
jgi:hypothetical protein